METQREIWTNFLKRRRDSSVGTPKGYGLVGPGLIPGSVRFFSFPQRPDRIWGPFCLLSPGYRGLCPPRIKRQGREADHSPPSRSRMVELYLHCPICLHGILLNKLSIETNSPFYFIDFYILFPSFSSALQLRVSFGLLNNQPPFLDVMVDGCLSKRHFPLPVLLVPCRLTMLTQQTKGPIAEPAWIQISLMLISVQSIHLELIIWFLNNLVFTVWGC
jgi:hypothetical protein